MKLKEIIVKEVTIDVAVPVHQAIPEFDSSWEQATFEKRYAGKAHLVLVAYIDEIAAGYMVSYDRDRDGSFYCWMAGVVPAFRQRGVLKKMMVYLENWAKQQGYTSLKIKTKNVRREMLRFLVQNDFQCIRVSRKDMAVVDYRIHLQKWFNPENLRQSNRGK